jgi:hypothetical protein
VRGVDEASGADQARRDGQAAMRSPAAIRRWLSGAGAILVMASATRAWALCPNCLGQNATLTPTLRIVGVFLLIPPAVFFFVVRIIRRLSR